ncbi:MAG: trypsin-like serine protease [Rhodanobacter sp.]
MTSRSGLYAGALLAVASLSAYAIEIRHDVPDAKYLISASELPALADLPVEGHGVLIAPQWVVTAGHAVRWQKSVDEVTIAGKPRKVEAIVYNPGFRDMPMSIEMGGISGIYDFIHHRDDIALVKLAEPVTDVAPVPLYRGQDELGKTAEIMGKGQTGNGLDGIAANASHRVALRRAYNVITEAEGRWLAYRFDAPPKALPLEGMHGGGDSGGPVLIQQDGVWKLAGLSDHQRTNPRAFGLYGAVAYDVRISHYADWIQQTTMSKK